MDIHPDDAYTTGGQRFRSPSHPDMIAALGRVTWNALTVEDMAVAVLYEAGEPDWADARALMAGEKEQRLRRLAVDLVDRGAGPGVEVAIREAADALARARREVRNVFAHAYAFTAESTDGRYLPGLAWRDKAGNRRKFSSPAEVLEAARRVEDAVDALGEARIVVRLWRGLSAKA